MALTRACWLAGPVLGVAVMVSACARPAVSTAKVPAPSAVVSSAPSPPRLQGSLFVFKPGGVSVCRAECRPLADDELRLPKHAPRRIGVGRYLFEKGVLDLRDESLGSVGFKPPEYGGLWALDDGRFVLVEHQANEDRLRFAKGAFQESIPPRSYGFRFLPDGRHLFKTAPLMGKGESPFFVDVIEGQTVTLSFVNAPGAEPKKLLGRSQFLHADFVGEGASIVYWVPGHVDEKQNLRRMQLEAVDVATGKVTGLGAVTSPVIAEGPFGKRSLRDTPVTHHYTHSRYVVHEAELDAAARPHAVRVVDVTTATSTDVPLADGEALVRTFSASETYFGGAEGRRDDDVLLLERTEPDRSVLRVLALPGLEPLFSVTVPGPGPVLADFVRAP